MGPALVYPKLVLLGDSLFQFSSGGVDALAPALQHRYQRRLDVVTRGFSGYTTRWVARMVEAIFAGLGPGPIHTVVLFLGTNDAAPPGAVQHVPLMEYASNLEAIAREALRHTPRLVIVGPTLVNEQGSLTLNAETGVPVRTNEANRKYAAAARDVAARLGVPFVDLYAGFQKALGEDPAAQPPHPGEEGLPEDRRAALQQPLIDLLHDGIHFGPAGYRALLDALTPVLAKPEDVPFLLPLWRSITDPEDFDPLTGDGAAQQPSQ